jgi:hypothetical protein
MKTSWKEIAEAEKYIFSKMNAEDLSSYKARLLVNPMLRLNLFYQEKVYVLVRFYHRKKLKEAAESIHHRLFNDPVKATFQQNIYQFFKN